MSVQPNFGTATRILDFYSALPKQLSFHQSMAPYRLHVGGYGSGKTLNLLMEAIINCLMIPGCNCLILRTTSPDIQRTVIDKFLNSTLVPRSIYKSYNMNKQIATFHNGSQLHFGYCQRDSDVNQFLSTEYVFIGLEEAGEFSYRVWEHLVGRARASSTLVDLQGNQVKPSMGLTTNPFGTGWPWIKQLFVMKQPIHGMGKYNPDDYFYVHSNLYDNPYTCTPEYIAKLESMTGSLRKQALEGDMDEVAGQAFPQFNTGPHKGVHVVHPSEISFKDYDFSWIGSDWDFAHWPVIWFRKGYVKDLLNGGERCVNVIYRELILREMNAVQAADEIVRACPPNDARNKLVKVKEHIKDVFFSWERFKHQGMDHTIAEQLGSRLVKFGIPRPQSADNKRVDGWALIGQLLDMDELVVTTDCPYVISTLPVLTRDTDNLGDIKKTESMEDDIADAIRYGLKSFYKPGKVPQSVKDAQALDRIQDPVAKRIRQYEQWIKKSTPKLAIKDSRIMPWQVR